MPNAFSNDIPREQTNVCPWDEKVTAYYANALSGEEELALELHLEECPVCSDEFTAMTEIMAVSGEIIDDKIEKGEIESLTDNPVVIRAVRAKRVGRAKQ
jgi:hypothetical protein